MEVMGSGKQAYSPFALAALCACALTMLLAPPTAAASCPNEGLREAQGATALPGCMALEMVSPPKKFSLLAFSPWFSRDGERIAYRSIAALADTPSLQFFGGDSYLATRGASGWQTAPTSPPASAKIALGSFPRGGPFAFASDLSRWLSLGATRPQVQVGVGRYYEGAPGGFFEPFSPLLEAQDNGGGTSVQLALASLAAEGVSADLSTLVARLSAPSAFFLAGDPRNAANSNPDLGRNSYVVSNRDGLSPPELLARDKDGVVYGGRCGARIGGGIDPGRVINQGAVSADGLRIYFTTRPAQAFDPAKPEDPAASPPCDTTKPLRVMERVGGPEEAEIAPIAPELPAGDDIFQGASADGTRVYFATAREVLPADNDTGAKCSKDLGSSSGCDLYLYDASKPEGSRLSLVTSGNGADVLPSITALSGDGTRAYFVAEGVLTADQNPAGATAIDGQPNLYLYDQEADETSFIGTLAANDQGTLWGTEENFIGDAYAVPIHGAGPGGDGHVLVFASEAPLTAGDDDGGHADLFRYDAVGDTLIRVSTAPDGGEDDGPFDVTVNANPPNTRRANMEEASRFASEDGGTIAFATAAALLPGDADAAENPYVWKAGELGFLEVPSGEDIPTVSPGGEQAAFVTPAQLLPQDRDFIKDVYVARVDGGFPFPDPPPPPCNPLAVGGCRPLGTPPPAITNPSATIAGAGNVRALKCKKGFVKKKGRCVKKKQKHRKGKAKSKGKEKR